ncbi:type II secretion system protein [Chlorogloeopsis sp. ULAP01]|uniref:pilus assembly FimT family protein n=1 Tax=Chlorogloeopsis sp. ULAP01 TaxID=3056483 RepID=UPI0025AAF754|nr:prepilin-type N-terminal cleavage/methylation domain-containing protein [Chlorogloeopsis sp. ULAP01]MDM9381066.1 type II secretion system protein [Chlorogloeopsis sp. ULAP01]
MAADYIIKKLNVKLFQIHSRNAKSKLRSFASGYNHQDAGFSLLEIVVVVLMIGILSAIVAPSWLGFVNRQQVNKANDLVLAALQEAQREAKKTKRSYSVSFSTNNTTKAVEVAIYPTKKPDGSNVTAAETSPKPLGSGVGFDSKKLLLGANLSSENTAGASVGYNLTTPTKITFDYMGALPNANFGSPPAGSTDPDLAPGLKIVVTVPKAGSTTEASATKRCVIVKTLLGSMLTAKDTDCN